MKQRIFSALSLFCLLPFSATASPLLDELKSDSELAVAPLAAATVMGVWDTVGGNGRVKMTDCGDGTPCGTLVWLNPKTTSGTTDENNPDMALKDRPLIGIKMLQGFKPKGSRWSNGTLYDPESGKTYKSHMRLIGDDKLQIKGCIGPLCKTQIWTRAADLVFESNVKF